MSFSSLAKPGYSANPSCPSGAESSAEQAQRHQVTAGQSWAGQSWVGQVVSCHRCGQHHRAIQIGHAERAVCVRCGAGLYRFRADAFDKLLALQIAIVGLLLIANAFPFLTLKAAGATNQALLMSGVVSLFDAGLPLMAGLMLFTGLLAPALTALGLIYLLLGLRRQRVSPGAARFMKWVMKWVVRLMPWNMLAVLMLGVLVSATKLVDLADVIPGPASAAFVVLVLVSAWAHRYFDAASLWLRIDPRSQGALPRSRAAHEHAHCHDCRLSVDLTQHRHCPRCASALHHRLPNSLARSWALLVTALLLLIPANLYPVMSVVQLAQGEPATLIGGVIALIELNMWPLALIVLFASVIVPLAKLGALAFLLISVQRGHQTRPKDRTRLFRITETIGAWSMVDIYVIAILAAVVQLGALANVEPQIGASFFGLAVITTMFAAHQFDPRLIWDRLDSPSSAVD